MPCANSLPSRPAPRGRRKPTTGRRRERSSGRSRCVILAAALTGYIAFATFLINQTIYLTALGSLLYLVDCIVQDGTEALLKPEAPVGAGLLAMVGLRRNVLAQIVVILQGVARLVVADDRDRARCSNRGACSRRTCSARSERPISASRSAASPCRCRR